MLVPGTPLTGPVDTDAAERCWCAYAWPVAAGNSGDRIFFVDQDGDVWQSPNAAKTCSGLLGGPAWDAAMPSGTGSVWAPLPAGDSHRGRDGNPWKRMN